MTTLTLEMMAELNKPFDPAAVQWKPGATTKDKAKALALAYADSRAYYDRLDQVAGPDRSDDYQISNDGQRVVCRLTIAGVTRCDVGECDGNDANTTTTAAAQAFKRACAKFGLGRYLYSLPRMWVEYDAQCKGFTDQALRKLNKLAGGSGAVADSSGNGSSNGAFPNPTAAVDWAMKQGCFDHRRHAENAYKKLPPRNNPGTQKKWPNCGGPMLSVG
jgi:hypothetical protein